MTSLDKKAYMAKWRKSNRERIRKSEKVYWAARPDQAKAKEERHRERRKPKMKVYRKAYRIKNLEIVRKKNRDWQQRQKLHRRQYMRRYYDANSDKFRNKASKWYRDNPGKHKAHVLKRLNKQAQCIPQETDVINAWMKEVRSKPFARCYWCGTKVIGKSIHFDHITPLSKGGLHSIGNLCASCKECNLRKHARLVTDWVVGGQYFLNI